MVIRSIMGAVCACLAVISFNVNAGALVIHQGQNDPTTEGWLLETTGTATGSLGGGSETTLTGVHNYWNIQDLSNTGSQFYTYSLTDANLSQNWRLEADLRIVDSLVCQNCTDVGSTAIIVADGMNYWSFYFSNSNAGPISNTGKSGQHSLLMSTPIDTRSDYHNYAIEFSQNGTGPADDTADFFVDGVLVFNDVGRSGLWTTSDKEVRFGPVSTLDFSDANFETVRFDVVPIPAAVWLFASGLIGLIGLARRKSA